MVRELADQNKGLSIDLDDLPEAIRQAGEVPAELQETRQYSELPLKDAKRQFESEYFNALLNRTSGNMTLASRLSRVGRPYLYKKIREHDIDPENFR